MRGHDTTKSVLDDLDPEERQRLRRKAKIRALVALIAAALATLGVLYVRYWMPKAPLGGACSYGLNCRAEAPRCMKLSLDADGVCSRACDVDAGDCAEGVRCIQVELDEERDDRGMPAKGGYCFPKAFVDARKSGRNKDAGAKP
jgi:hypothetical protein